MLSSQQLLDIITTHHNLICYVLRHLESILASPRRMPPVPQHSIREYRMQNIILLIHSTALPQEILIVGISAILHIGSRLYARNIIPLGWESPPATDWLSHIMRRWCYNIYCHYSL